MLLLFLIITIVNIGLKYTILHSIAYASTLDYFHLYYSILFCLWAPSCLFGNFIINLYYKTGINYLSFQNSINLSSFSKFTVFVVGAFSLKFVLVLYLNQLYFDKNIINCFNTSYRKIVPLNLWQLIAKFIKIRAFRPSVALSMIPFTYGSSNYINGKTDDSFVPDSHLEEENQVIPPNYKYIDDARLYIPNTSTIDVDRDIWKQLSDQKLDTVTYVNMGNSKVTNLSYLKTFCTRALHKQLDLFLIPNAKITNSMTPFDYPAFKKELEVMDSHKNLEAYTYGPMNAMLNFYFPLHEGYIVVPQSKETAGEVDFLVKKWNVILCVVESKAEEGRYSLTKTYAQAIQYANNNHDIDDCYVIINKGTFISVGAYLQDHHSSRIYDNGSKKYDNKSIFFDGYIGLEVGPNGVKQVGQKDTFYPQHKLYKMGTDIVQKSAIHELMLHVKIGHPNSAEYDD